MMAGRKRLASFEAAPDSNDSVNGRIFTGLSFDVHRAQPSQQQSIGTPTLDRHRAELSRQHVRALNTQYASWVQSQLQNHPDELWEDGVQDYLNHASNIKDKFSDIVNWLKTNTLKGESVFGTSGLGSQDAPKKMMMKTNSLQGESVFGTSVLGSQDASKKLMSESKDNMLQSVKEQSPFGAFLAQSVKEQSPFGAFSSTPSFGNSGAFKTQSSFSFGSQIAAPSINVSSNDVDGEEDESPQPSSPSVKKTEEKGTIVVHEVKCKLYVKSIDPADKDAWKDKGTGQLSIKCKEGVSKGTKESKPIILVRNDVGKILLNASLYPGIRTSVQKNSIVAIFHTVDDSGKDGDESNSVVARTFLIRVKSEDDRNKLAEAIKEYAPASGDAYSSIRI